MNFYSLSMFRELLAWSLISNILAWCFFSTTFSLTLNTTAFDYGTLEWFKTSICMSVLVDFHHQIHNTHTIIRSTAHYLDYIKRNTTIYFFVSYSYLSIESTEFIPFAYYESEGRKSGHKISLKPWAWDQKIVAYSWKQTIYRVYGEFQIHYCQLQGYLQSRRGLQNHSRYAGVKEK